MRHLIDSSDVSNDPSTRINAGSDRGALLYTMHEVLNVEEEGRLKRISNDSPS